MLSSYVSSSTRSIAQAHDEGTQSSSKGFFRFEITVLAILVLALIALLVGCGGGYVGTGIVGLSTSKVTLDSGQSFAITANTAGSPALSWTLSGPTCSGASCGTVTNTNGSATYTAPTVAVSTQVTLTAAASGSGTTSSVAITVNPAPTVNTNLPHGSVGVPYTTTLVPSGGSAPVKMALSGSLPEGLNFDATTGVISGTPTAAETVNFGITLTDTSQVPFSTTVAEMIVIGTTPTQLAILGGNPPAGTVGTAYSTALTASGGTAPYMWTTVSGSLPAGLSLNASTGAITGTPTAAGSSTFTAQVQDANGTKATASFTIVINAQANTLAISVTSLPNGTVGVAYSATVPVTGGTAPYTCVFTGALPAGLTAANCTVSGTPTTVGTSNLTLNATDSSSPQAAANGPISITIGANAQTLVLTTTSLPNGTVGVPYSATVGVAGGTAPYDCTFSAGTLPAGLTASGCTVSGTPTTAGTSNLTVTATDASSPQQTVSGPESITINAATVLVIGNPPTAIVGAPYSGTIPVSGGTGPYTCTITSGTLPTGLTLGANCTITGTPTVAGMTSVTVKATDSSSPSNSSTGTATITVDAGATLTLSNPPTATAGTPYTGTIPVTGGTGPYTCTITSGVLPAGLTISNCTISGTPTTAGSTTPTVKVTDSSHPTNTTTGPVTVTVTAGTSTIAVTSPPPATVGTPYTGPIGITGGKGPYTCTLASGTLTNGLSLQGCTIVGTPTAPGNQAISVTVTDSNTPPDTTTAPITVVVNPAATLTLTGSLPNAIVNQPYSQTLQATGGVAPYTYAITAGTLPAGINLSSAGVVSGTPTVVGASSFTVTATDSEGTPQTASLPLVLLVTYAQGGNESELTGPYAYLFQGYDDGVIGVLSYQTASVGSFTADGTGVISAGELDENHQATTIVGTTANSEPFIGTYTVGTDNRGFATITRINADGTTGTSSTYAIALKAPVAPATNSAQGSLIEYDNDQLAGTKGSGTLLAQTTTAFANGLNGNYVFGAKGDTPCLLTCNASLVGGAVAEAGEFTGNSGGVIAGEADATLAATTYPTSALAGSFGTADSNGRLRLTMTTEGMTNGVYPGDYAVYIVDATQAFLVSIDKHSDYILLAGSMQTRSTTTFNNASLTGPFIGYENAATNPGLLSALVENVLNFSTATIFRDTATADGKCDVTNADVGGLTALVTNVGGLLGGLTNLLGEANATGATTCAVDVNGRAVLTNPTVPLLGAAAPRVAYLSSPDKGYFVETGYAGLGNIEPQTGAPYTQASFKGTYVFGDTPASSVASINSSGVITADGSGTATSTVDENIGVGTINILKLGVTQSSGYSTPDATTGRFVLNGTDVVYVISPGRFVFVDTNPLTTSPSVTLLY